MIVEIDDRSGFCFGVVNAISAAEARLEAGVAEMAAGAAGLVSLGDIVHNGAEVARLRALGLETVPEQTDLASLAGRTVLIRAHGEPPETYEQAEAHGITIVEATCPVVARLQKTVRDAHAEMSAVGGGVVIFGRRGHAEVRGLAGQVGFREKHASAALRSTPAFSHTPQYAAGRAPSQALHPCTFDENQVMVVENEADLDTLDFARPICFLAQTTSSLAEFRRLGEIIRRRALDPDAVTIRDTVCRQVADREEHLAEFARRFDAVVFVAGAKSSNGRVLFDAVKAANPRSHKIENASELCSEWFDGVDKVGVCGATSTPGWSMREVADAIEAGVSRE
ncbi:MAG: 4-hydroxy-3-methylbut-2-enyl diphosphate reductase [Alistipes sp.]|jgi:4-hydroxy-3-methylbut-2-enyl diphosphate reductase|nr:4-hydroxy-3-methylbut-2-enyl diphosphate reductase [Alistipes sp.]